MRRAVSFVPFMFGGLVALGAACGSSGGTGTGASGTTSGLNTSSATNGVSSSGGGEGGAPSMRSSSASTSGGGEGGTTTTSTGNSSTSTGNNTSSSNGTTTTSSGSSVTSSSGSMTNTSSSSTSSGSSTSSSSSSGAVTGFPFPSVINNDPGPVVAAPKIVTVTFKGDPDAATYATFGANITQSSYWSTISAGFCGPTNSTCIGAGPTGTAVALTTAAAKSYTDSSQGGKSSLQTAIEKLITAGTLPTPDDNTIYAFYFPATTTVTLDGATSCTDFGGYHNSLTTSSGQAVVYAVINECAQPAGSLPPTTLQETTLAASHEFIEAATDPGTNMSFSYYLDFNQEVSLAWNALAGGEVGDLCVDELGLGQDEATENGFTVQRIWSIAQANAGKNPCVPIPSGEVYFNAFPNYQVLTIDVGQSEDITITALADGPMSAWPVHAVDITDQSTAYLNFTIKGGTVNDAGTSELMMKSGDTATMTVSLLADPANSQNGFAQGVMVSANGTTEATVTAGHLWPFIVLTKAEASDAGFVQMAKKNAAGIRQKFFKTPHSRQRVLGF